MLINAMLIKKKQHVFNSVHSHGCGHAHLGMPKIKPNIECPRQGVSKKRTREIHLFYQKLGNAV